MEDKTETWEDYIYYSPKLKEDRISFNYFTEVGGGQILLRRIEKNKILDARGGNEVNQTNQSEI